MKDHTLKCYNFWKLGISVVYYPNGKEIKSTDLAMGSRQDNHDIDITTSQINLNSLLYVPYLTILIHR